MPRYLYEEIADDLRERIGPGREFPPGAKLPSRAELRERYKGAAGLPASDFVLDAAMRILRQEGLTVTLTGKGVYVPEDA